MRRVPRPSPARAKPIISLDSSNVLARYTDHGLWIREPRSLTPAMSVRRERPTAGGLNTHPRTRTVTHSHVMGPWSRADPRSPRREVHLSEREEKGGMSDAVVGKKGRVRKTKGDGKNRHKQEGGTCLLACVAASSVSLSAPHISPRV